MQFPAFFSGGLALCVLISSRLSMPLKKPRKVRHQSSDVGRAQEEPAVDDAELDADGAGSEADAELDAGHADSEWLPVEYETRVAHDSLPWQDASLELSGVEAKEEGFCGLEELPAGSYDIDRTPAGGIVIRVRKDKGQVAPAAEPVQQPPAAPLVAAAKRKRAVDDASLATGPRPSPAPASFAPAEASVALDPAAVAAEWAPLGLHPLLLAAVGRLGFARPTRIQQEAVSGRETAAPADFGCGRQG